MSGYAKYVAVSGGMAMGASSFAMLAAMCSVVGAREIVWIVVAGGLLTGVVASAIAGLASVYPSAPGLATYLKRAFGSQCAVAASLLYLSVVVCVVTAECAALSEVARAFLPPIASKLLGPGLLAAVIACNLSGLELPWRVQLYATGALLGLVLGASAFAFLRAGSSANVDPHAATAAWPPILAGVGMSVFLFLGFEWVAPLGRSAGDYRRVLPRSIIGAVVLLVVVYATCASALARSLGPTWSIEDGLNVPLVSPFSMRLSAVAVVLCAAANVTVFNACILGGSRLAFGLARQGSLPAVFAKVHTGTGTPVGAIGCVGSISLCGSLTLNVAGISTAAAEYAAAVECLMYAALVFAWLRLQAEAPEATVYRPPVPRFILAFVGCVMPVIGLAALRADARYAWAPTVTFVLSVLAALTWSRRINRDVGLNGAPSS